MLVLALPGASHIAADLAGHLHCGWSELAVHEFPDGETLVRIDAAVEGRCVVLTGSLHRPDAKTLPLVFAADAARELGASQVGLAAPYLAYMRQDRRFNPGEAITSRSYARLLSTSLDFLVTVDPHLHRWRNLDELYPIRTHVVASAPAVARWVRENVQAPLLVGPDAESAQWVAEVARLCEASWTVMEKTRRGDRDVSLEPAAGVSWTGRTPVLVDDIISTAGTLSTAARLLRSAGFPSPLCVGVHAVFVKGAIARLQAAGLKVVTCNTLPHRTNAIDLEGALAVALGRATP